MSATKRSISCCSESFLKAATADFSDPGQSFQRDGGQRFKLIADSLGARKCLG
ncbi:hypothetical protein OU995_14460 [Roseateles sp. SL47]|uniref:hypothetical protein n=1 Tax=Roseateles sp. SL47 TaxID=2995138 RepID=UPI00226E1135|nr:hypothetical protein [Roseateles sp. SL47]WAC76008.1 hypothetical protein OU995_14460 [Roseateles sp. SL47]